MDKKYLVSYEVKRKGLKPTIHNATEYASSKNEIREYYKMLKYKVIKIEELKGE